MGGLTAKATTNTSIFVSWMPPFSLEITPTNTETGTIFYCVDIYNTIISHLVSVCGLAGTQFVYFPVDPSPCDSVNVVVTPVNAAGNGSRSHSTGVFYNGEMVITLCHSLPTHSFGCGNACAHPKSKQHDLFAQSLNFAGNVL